MNKHVIQVSVSAPDSLVEPAIALLAEIGYAAFEEKETGLEAYIEEGHFDQNALQDTLSILGDLRCQTRRIAPRNWNAEWEANFKPVEIGQFCQIIPSFLKSTPDFTYTLYIEPKMAFGTGHHETTRLMVRQLSGVEMTGKTVLDMGCGTGVLGLLALKMGAKSCLGIDIDSWSIENSRENAQLNNLLNLQLLEGDASVIPDLPFDLILANINRNVLLQDIPVYASRMVAGSSLILSGFYEQDKAAIEAACTAAGLVAHTQINENNWCSLHVEKYINSQSRQFN